MSSVEASLAASKAAVAASQAAVAANQISEPTPAPQPAAAETKKDDGLNIETSKLDDTNFDNLGQSTETNPEDSKKEVQKMAADAEKADEKKMQELSKVETIESPKPKEQDGSFSIETSSLADPFDAPAEAAPVAKSEDKPKEDSKVQLNKHKHKRHHRRPKHHKKHHH